MSSWKPPIASLEQPDTGHRQTDRPVAMSEVPTPAATATSAGLCSRETLRRRVQGHPPAFTQLHLGSERGRGSYMCRAAGSCNSYNVTTAHPPSPFKAASEPGAARSNLIPLTRLLGSGFLPCIREDGGTLAICLRPSAAPGSSSTCCPRGRLWPSALAMRRARLAAPASARSPGQRPLPPGSEQALPVPASAVPASRPRRCPDGARHRAASGRRPGRSPRSRPPLPGAFAWPRRRRRRRRGAGWDS